LSAFEKRWLKQFGLNLRLAHRINQRIANWDGAKWDRRLELLNRLSPEQFADALKTNLTSPRIWSVLISAGLQMKSLRS
jgi:hypothetical protein